MVFYTKKLKKSIEKLNICIFFTSHQKIWIWQFKQNHESKAEQNLLSAISFFNSFRKFMQIIKHLIFVSEYVRFITLFYVKTITTLWFTIKITDYLFINN